MENLKELGTYVTIDGKKYDCIFFPEDETAEAIGPLPKRPIDTGSRKAKFKVIAKTEDEARKAFKKVIGDGYFKNNKKEE